MPRSNHNWAATFGELLIPRIVNFLLETRRAKKQECPGENGGDLVNGLGPISVGVVHEQSPWTTHNGLRFAVEALSGGLST